MNNQGAKADAGKLPLTLVPLEIIRNIAEIRRYGKNKYGSSENWKTIEPVRYRDAMFRHMLLYLEDPYGVDEESGLPHLWHLACNVAFLCELEKDELKPRQDGVDLSKIKCVDLSGATEEQKSKLKEILAKSAEAEMKAYDTVITPDSVVDSEGFDWKQGDYVKPTPLDYETNFGGMIVK